MPELDTARTRPADSHRVAAICDAALELLQDVGYDRLTVDAIAARAHASKATLYRHWPQGKAQLVVTALKSRSAPPVICADTGSLRSDLLALLGGVAAALTREDVGLMAGLLLAMRSDEELATAVREQVLEDKEHLAEQLVARAVDRGEAVRPDAAALLHELLPALLFTHPLLHGAPIDEPYLKHVVDDVILPVLTHSAAGAHSKEKS
jgi:AcrR family transcriptional regulator